MQGGKAQEGLVVEGYECGKEATEDVQAEEQVEGNEEDKKCEEVPQKNRRTKRSQAKAGCEGDDAEQKIINMLYVYIYVYGHNFIYLFSNCLGK